MSNIAYEPIASINAWSCSECKSFKVENVKGFNNAGGDLQGFTAFSVDLNGIVVSFRGSSNIQNWITNLNTGLTNYPKCSGCQVHQGFFAAWGLAKSIVLTNIQNLRAVHRDAPIYVTGHSLGGALATLAAD